MVWAWSFPSVEAKACFCPPVLVGGYVVPCVGCGQNITLPLPLCMVWVTGAFVVGTTRVFADVVYLSVFPSSPPIGALIINVWPCVCCLFVALCPSLLSNEEDLCSTSSHKKHPNYYSWIGHPVRTHKKSICRETERATTDLKLRTKSSRQGASTGARKKSIVPFLDLFLKNRQKMT